MDLLLHADGQWASEPLVVTEQYFVGGLDTVRGYIQYESLGDHAVRGRAELTGPEMWPIPIDRIWQRRRSSEWDVKWKLAAFYDAANLWIRDAPRGQQDQFRLESAGWGLRVRMPKDVGTVRIDQGFALQNATVTKRGDTFVHFLVNVVY
jgi:hemolysin activation/secretion protein